MTPYRTYPENDGNLMTDTRNNAQKIWAIALILAGVGVFIRIPQVMPKIEQIQQFSSVSGYIRFCFYFMGIFLIGGGCKKLYTLYGDRSNINKDP